MSKRRLSLAVLLFLVLLCEEASSFFCNSFPCNVDEECTPIDVSSCSHGAVLDACLCCTVCARGPGERCDNLIQCGVGLRCFKDIPEDLRPHLSDLEIDEYPGTCVVGEGTTTAAAAASSETTASTTSSSEVQTTTTTETLAHTPATNVEPPATTTATRNTERATNDATTTELPPSEHTSSSPPATAPAPNCSSSDLQQQQQSCRQRCSIQQCSGTKHKLCSAAGMAISPVEGRGVCQMTSCHACFLHVDAPCSVPCPNPPRKSCMKRYSQCIRNWLEERHSSPTILRLEDPEAAQHTGRVECYVPALT